MRLCVYQLQALPAKEGESLVHFVMCVMKFNYPDAIMDALILLSPSPPIHPPHPILPTQEEMF